MVPLCKSTSEEELSSLMTHRSTQMHSMIYPFLGTAVDLMLWVKAFMCMCVR